MSRDARPTAHAFHAVVYADRRMNLHSLVQCAEDVAGPPFIE